VSCGEGVALIRAARAQGVDVTCETCPHYLALTEDDFLRLGSAAKCAPPLRPAADQQSLWRPENIGSVHTVGSDHSPAPAELKSGANFFKVWGGIAGVQHTLPLLLTEGFFKGRHELTALTRQLSAQVAARFKLPPDKGRMEIGAEADLALVDLGQEYSVCRDELLDRHRFSPYVGRRLRGQVVRTLLRGQTLYHDGKIVSKPLGHLIKPLRA
jgi:allantoinase